MPRINHWPHLGEKEGHQQRRDMRPVHIRVGHDDDFVIAQIIKIKPRAEPDT